MEEARASEGPMEFYDSNTGKLLFTAPVGRTMNEFLIESAAHGWPSFRDSEVCALQKIPIDSAFWRLTPPPPQFCV